LQVFFPEYHSETTRSDSLMSKHVLVNSIIWFYSYYSYHFIDRIRQNSERKNRSALKNIRVHMGNLNHLRFQQLIASKSVEFKCATCWGSPMRKKCTLSAFWIIVLIIWFVLVGYSHFVAAQNATNVSGTVASDAAWIKANSPYNLTANVLINSGATLTIEAGTTVDLNNHYIRVDGTLIIEQGVVINIKSAAEHSSIQVNGVMTARGTRSNPIQINGAVSGQYLSPDYSSIVFSQSSSGWNENNSLGSILENAMVHSTYLEIENSLKIVSVTFVDGEINILDGSPVISNCSIGCRVSISGGSPVIVGNSIVGGFVSFYGKTGGENVEISDNVISRAQTSMGKGTAGIWFGGSQESGGHVLIQRNLITENQDGIQIFRPNSEELKTSLTIQNNTIANNTVAISVLSRCSPIIILNNIYSYSFNIQLSQDATNDIDASHNWWGTTDDKKIIESIYDSRGDSSLGTVNYDPFLTVLNPNATPDPNASSTTIPVPTATPSPTSTPSVSPSPKANSSPEPTPTSKPALNQETPQEGQLETIISMSVTGIIFGAGAGFLIYLIRRK
jgi:hypothetical protein